MSDRLPVRPWYVRPIHENGRVTERAVIVDSCGFESMPFLRPVAELIVRCVNAEESVIAALEATVDIGIGTDERTCVRLAAAALEKMRPNP